MKTHHRPHPVITQSQNNATLWIGHLKSDPTDHFGGQTFKCPAKGMLDNIQVFSSAVQDPGEIMLTLHQFDSETKKWGPSMTSATIQLEKNDADKWLRFNLDPVAMNEGQAYGFRLQASNAMIAIGEAVTGNKNPFTGEEWHADSLNQAGHFYRHFSLAFKVEMCD